MADTINVPGLGPTKSVYVYAGGALVVGIVGYAWWKNSQNQPTDFVGASADDYGVGDYDSPLGSTGGNSTGNYTSIDPEAIDTNPEWVAAAIDRLSDRGYDAGLVTATLGKYLARLALTEAEIAIVHAAIAVAGTPPVGGPYPITPAVPVPNPNGNGGNNNPPPPPVTLPTRVFYLRNSNPPRWALGVGSPKRWTETGSQTIANSWAAAYEADLNADYVNQSEWNAEKAKYSGG